MSKNKAVRKKVLIITYYWPPSGGIGVLRCLKFAKYLRNYGWEPIIYTALNPSYPSIDPSNLKDVPEGVTVLKGKIWEPYDLYKKFTGQKKDANVNNVLYVSEEKLSLTHKLSVWIRSNFFIPDARAFWIKPSVKFLVDYLEKNPVDAMLTDGPPHSNTRIATLLKQKTGTPWLADFQDPWTQVDYFKALRLTKWGYNKHRRQELEAFAAADRITIVSDSWKKDLETIGAKNVSVIPWGYDPEDFSTTDTRIDEKFTMSHLGIMGLDRLPEALFRVIKKMMTKHSNFKDHFELNLYGQVDFSIVQKAKEIGIENVFHLKGSVPRSEAIAKTRSSNLLLLLLNQQDNVMGRIPGKLFEYMAAGRPILVQGPPNSDVGKIVAETNRGETINYEDENGLLTFVEAKYAAFLTGKLKSNLTSDISNYSSPVLVGKIASLLDEITGPKN